jgi:hypothetical protein
MTQPPKEKADELILRYLRINNNTKEWFNLHIAKQCALIAVDEIINSSPLEPNFADLDDCGGEHRYYHDAQKTHALHYWQEVKKEIEKL